MPMPPEYTDAYVVGADHGYNHANYAENVGGQVIDDSDAETERQEVPPSYADDGPRQSGYTTGFRDGIDAYHRAQKEDENETWCCDAAMAGRTTDAEHDTWCLG